VERLYSATRGLPVTPADRLARQRVIADGLSTLRGRDPERFADVSARVRAFLERLSRFGVTERALGREGTTGEAVRFVVRELALAVVLVPVALAGILAYAVPYLVVSAIASGVRLGLEERATHKVVGGLLIYVVWTMLVAGLIAWYFGVAAGVAAALVMPAAGVAGLHAAERELSAQYTARVWLAARGTSSRARTRLLSHARSLTDLLDEVHAELQAEKTEIQKS
jgi:hypothetical protein